MPRRTGTERARAGACAAALVAALGLATGVSCAQVGAAEHQDAAAKPARATGEFTGRTFSGLTVAAATQAGDIRLAAQRGAVWTEASEVTGGRPVSRLLLSGDVVVDLGIYHFTAARAVVWLERTGAAEGDPAATVHQIAVYFDRVDNPSAQAGVSQHGDRLLVTGMLAGKLSMKVDLLREGRPEDPLLREGEERMVRLLREVAGTRAGAAGPAGEAAAAEAGGAAPPAEAPIRPGESRGLEPPTAPGEGERGVPEASRLGPGEEQSPPIFTEHGIFTVVASSIVRTQGAPDAWLASGTAGVVIEYVDLHTGEMLLIQAQRAVLFKRPGSGLELGAGDKVPAGDVEGIYLEGDVVTTAQTSKHGGYTVRAPRVFYDVRNKKAIVLDAVFWTFDEEAGFPLYVRAAALRQEAENQFSATRATLSNSSFADPLFAIGASSVTVTQRKAPGEPTRTHLEADDLTMRVGPVPFFYWPHFSGDVDHIPLRRLAAGVSGGTGPVLHTGWDVFGLLGLDPPPGVRSNLLLDAYFERGMAVGTDTAWHSDDAAGSAFLYGLFHDTGTDRMPSGTRIGHDGDDRDLLLGEHRWTINENWTLFLEGSYISDPAFVPAFFRDRAESAREFTNAAYLRRLEDDSSLTLLVKGEFNDFTANEYLLQSQGYNTDKLPEGMYRRLADDLLPGVSPGLLTWSSEYRLSRLRMNFTEPTATELGFDTPLRSQEALGLAPNQSPADRLRAMGLSESPVDRFDTRQELTATADWGPVKFVPFVVGRITSYDTSFETFDPTEDDQTRLWGSAGMRASTSVYTVNDAVQSDTLDLHRMRHIIEPNATVWTSGANIRQTQLPVFDDEVESIATGSAVRAGVKQTFQTQRGGEGRWRSVDWLTLSTDVTFASHDADRESPVARFFDYRPEYSLLGNFGSLAATWRVTDAVAVTALENYDFDLHQSAYTVLGARVDHTPEFSSYVEARYINARNITILGAGVDYRLTRIYTVEASMAYDLDQGQLQWVGGAIRRRFPELTVGLRLGYNRINDDYGISVEVEPLGTDERMKIWERLQQPPF